MPDAITDTIELDAGHGQALTARIERPAGDVADWALFAPDLAPDDPATRRIGRALADRGIAVARFDPVDAAVPFAARVDGLVAAADRLRRAGRGPRILVGHGLGGAAVLAAAGEIPEASAVAVIAAPADPGYLRRQLGDDAENGTRAILDEIEHRDLPARAGRLQAALLVLHSPLDRSVSIEHARRLFEAARQPKSFVSLDEADHGLTDPGDADYAAAMLGTWLARYVAAPAPDSGPALQPGEVLVRENGLGAYANDVHAGAHRLPADEPRSAGGDDTGPAPYEYLLASLGACTSITLRMYAARKGLALEHVAVRLRHRQVHAEDCADCEHHAGRVDRIERRIRLHGDLTDEQRVRLLEIADRCPVHRTLTGQLEIHSEEDTE